MITSLLTNGQGRTKAPKGQIIMHISVCLCVGSQGLRGQNRTTWHLPGTVTGPDHALPMMEHVMFPEELEASTIRGPDDA